MTPLRVVIASPVESLLKSYRSVLSQEGFTVVTADDALDCVANLREFEPDVLVLDHDLPWGRSEGVLATIEEDASMPDVPVIVLSNNHDPEMEEWLRSNQRGELHLKPLEPATLADRIRGIVAQRANENA